MNEEDVEQTAGVTRIIVIHERGSGKGFLMSILACNHCR